MDLDEKRALSRHYSSSARGLRERAEMSLAEAKDCDAKAAVLDAEIEAEELEAAKAKVAAAAKQ